MSTAVYIRNRCPTAALDNKTPHQCWFDEKPDLTSLCVFGSLCYVHVPNDQRQKLDAKSYKAIFVGYPDGTKGYKVFNISNGKFYRTRDVLFNENDFHTFDNTAAPGKKEVSNIVLPDVSGMYYDDSGEIVHDDENVDGGVAIPAHIVDNELQLKRLMIRCERCCADTVMQGRPMWVICQEWRRTACPWLFEEE